MSIFPTKILLAVDGSEEATLAAQTAVDLSNKTSSELHIAHVVYLETPFYLTPLYSTPEAPRATSRLVEEAREEIKREAQSLLDEQVKQIEGAGGTVAEAHLRTGRPEAEIVTLAEEIDAGLIVLGSRGVGGLRRALMGSISDSVVRHAHCPVLVVRK